MFSPFHFSKVFLFYKNATTHYYYSPKINLNLSHFQFLSSFSTTATTVTVTPPKILKKKKSIRGYNNGSYVVSYLINTCGLSLERAEFASKTVKFRTRKKPDSVLELLQSYEFTKAQISSLVRIRPILLLFDPLNTLLPKLEFFYSIGVSKVDVAKIVSRNPVLLERSLENHIVPFYKFLKGVLGNSDKLVVRVFKRQTRVFFQDHLKYIHPNLEVLREIGVTESSIVLLMANFPETTTVRRDQFLKTVIEVKEMGFNPLKSNFVLALHALSGESNKMIWGRCFKQYKKWGLSDDEILAAFEKSPNCMLLSENKIERTMDFLVNKFRCRLSEIVIAPHVLGYSLDKRIVPRCSVIQVLFSKGLLKKCALSSMIVPTEDLFLERYIVRFEDQVPQLRSVYAEGKWTFGNSNVDKA